MSLGQPISASEAVKTLTDLYTSYISNGVPIKNIPSVFLWGKPGVGKSESVREIKSNLENKFNKKVTITDIRLALYNPVDLRGVPTFDEKREAAIWLQPKVFKDMDSSKDSINLLFLDELSSAPTSLQAVAYQITLDKKVGEHYLPENCIVIAAGNRVTDNSVSFEMPKALANRMIHLEVEPSIDSWLIWAKENDIDNRIIKFLEFKPDFLSVFEPDSEDLAFPSPRTWTMASSILSNLKDEDSIETLLSGLLGKETYSEFKYYTNHVNDLKDLPNILDGIEIEKITDLSLISSYCDSITYYAKKTNDIVGFIERIYTFAKNIPLDCSMTLLDELLGIAYHTFDFSGCSDILTKWACEVGNTFKTINEYDGE